MCGNTSAQSAQADFAARSAPSPGFQPLGSPALLRNLRPSYVRMDLLRPVASNQPTTAPTRWTVSAGDRIAEAAASIYPDHTGDFAALTSHLTFAWDQMDAWYEEEEEIFVHARDPYRR